MVLRKVNLASVVAGITEYWSPKIGGDINQSQVKFAKLKATFDWHHHENEDELFLVIKGTLRMKLSGDEGGDVVINEGEYLIVPKGVSHCPEAVTAEVHCLLLEPATSLNTGNVINERTRIKLENISS